MVSLHICYLYPILINSTLLYHEFLFIRNKQYLND